MTNDETTLYTVITAYYDGTPHEIVAVEDASEARRLVIEEAKWPGTSWAGCPELDFTRIGDFARADLRRRRTGGPIV
jgi:hypothetical protein